MISGQFQRGLARRRWVAVLSTMAGWLAIGIDAGSADELSAAGTKAPPAALADPSARSLAPAGAALHARIEQLIGQLGSPRFAERRTAASELRELGANAFDALQAATENSDPEIAASANYLLRRIVIRWIEPDDPVAVKGLLRRYGQESEAARLQKVEQLARLPQNAGLAALCRIARFDRSPIVSRSAALAIIEPSVLSRERLPIDAALVEQQLGASTRVGAIWLRHYLAQQRDPATAVATWKRLVDQETARLDQSTETSPEILFGLQWNLADLNRQIGDQAATIAVLDRMMELTGDSADELHVQLLQWLTAHKSWETLEVFLSKHEARLAQAKRPLYHAALARVEQGRRELAEKLAATAANIPSPGRLEGFISARELEERNQFDWAVREYRAAIDKQPGETGEPYLARISLANLLHDHEQDKEAADVLEPLVKSVQGDGRTGQFYAKVREYYGDRLSLPDSEGIAARYHFYRGCQFQQEKDFIRARDEFDLAIKFDPQDADVLIAMYRLPEAADKWRDSVRQRLRHLAEKFEREIEENPTDATPYNQWAWLVSNTEGDFKKAIRYSHRSLELNDSGDSGAASYLDTLGRCYYAAGDLENAVKYERQALEKVSYMQVMHRQLALFEKELAEKSAKNAAEKPK